MHSSGGGGPSLPSTNLDLGVTDSKGWKGLSRAGRRGVGRRKGGGCVGQTRPHGGMSSKIWPGVCGPFKRAALC